MNLYLEQVLLILSLFVTFVHLNSIADGFRGPTDCLKCHDIDKDKINVHLVPHSHDDVGWLKTLDQYYYGLNNSIQRASVQYIITSVVHALSENPDRRFIQVETAFFWKWWKDQSESMRKKFTDLVNKGQIEMVNGAWAMNDEACTNYQSTIDQFTWGLRLLKQTVGSCGTPRVGWQIDPFGHSREQASIFAQLGFDGVFFARLDHDDKKNRIEKKSLDFAWQGSANIPNKTIFGGIFPTWLYYPPDGFCWDYVCNDDTIDDNTNSSDYNLDKKVKIFSDLMQNYSGYYQTKNILIPMGGDFHFAAAEANFINMDKLIKALKNDSKLNVIYSTPSCYIKSVHDANPTLTLKTDDFFPYSENPHSFWTGYFSSRPTTKRFERVGHNILQAVKQLIAFNTLKAGKNQEKSLTALREVMGTFQHHDAVTGTEKEHVAKDYVRQLTRAIEEAEKPIGEIIRNLIGNKDLPLDLASCILSNVSICTASQNAEKFVVLVYNPLSWPVTHYVRLPIGNIMLTVKGPDGAEKCDVVPTFDKFDFVKLSPQKPSSHEIVFAAKNIPPLGFKIYFVEKSCNDTITCKPANTSKTFTFGNAKANFMVNETTNLLKSITLNNKTVGITQNFFYYDSETGIAEQTGIASGAYIFRPESSKPKVVSVKVEKMNAFSGDVVDEFHQMWTTDIMTVKQSIRIYKDEGYIEFDWIVGNISVGNNITGKEVVTKFAVTESFDNKNVSFTDANGREMIKRILNSRRDYYYNPAADPVASNYYPVTSKIVIKDNEKNLEVAVLNDRSQGGASLAKGEIELMVHRRIFRDDHKGVEECLNETEFGTGLFVRGSHFLVLGPAVEATEHRPTTAAQERILAQQKLLQPWVGVASTNVTFKEIEKTINTPFQQLESSAVSRGINILTFEPWDANSYLLRLEHIFEKDDDKVLSSSKIVNLQNIFKGMIISDFQETVLGGNQRLEDFKKKEKYNWTTSETPMDVAKQEPDKSRYEISLSAMQIRTFIVKLEKSSPSFGNSIQPVFSLILSLFIIKFVIY